MEYFYNAYGFGLIHGKVRDFYAKSSMGRLLFSHFRPILHVEMQISLSLSSLSCWFWAWDTVFFLLHEFVPDPQFACMNEVGFHQFICDEGNR